MTDEDFAILSKKEYRGVINYEGILGGHLNRVATYRDTDPKKYASSVETYALMCPPDICEKSLSYLKELGLKRCDYDGITIDKKLLYDELWQYINKALKDDAGLIFKTASYEVGIE